MVEAVFWHADGSVALSQHDRLRASAPCVVVTTAEHGRVAGQCTWRILAVSSKR